MSVQRLDRYTCDVRGCETEPQYVIEPFDARPSGWIEIDIVTDPNSPRSFHVCSAHDMAWIDLLSNERVNLS